MGRKQRVLSDPAARILQYFVDRPDDELWGWAIIRKTGIASGTLYPALRLLAEDRGYLTSRWEEMRVEARPRPPRKFYRLDITSRTDAEDALQRHKKYRSRTDTRVKSPTPRSAPT